jgi:hypothetical protein
VRASVRATTRKSAERRACTATIDAAHGVGQRHHAPVGRVPALLGHLLILDLDRLHPCLLVAAHGMADVEQPAEAGVGVGDGTGALDALGGACARGPPCRCQVTSARVGHAQAQADTP